MDTMTDSSAMRVTLTKGKTAPAPQGKATYVASKGALIFLASNLEQLQPGKTYELWLIPAAAGGSPIPAGTFRPDERGNASVIMPPLPKGVEAKAFGVTVEDEGGATAPTPPIILAGE
jgi:anti-sigma-K factor RskA